MIVTGLVVLVAVAVIAYVAWRADRKVAEAVGRLEAETGRLQEQLEGQAKVQYKQGKAFQRDLTSTHRGVNKALDEYRSLLSDTRQTHEIVQNMVREVRGHSG